MSMISYIKNSKNSMYFITIDSIKVSNKICEYLNITFEEYIEIIKLCGGRYSAKYGWFLPNEESAVACSTMLSLIKK